LNVPANLNTVVVIYEHSADDRAERIGAGIDQLAIIPRGTNVSALRLYYRPSVTFERYTGDLEVMAKRRRIRALVVTHTPFLFVLAFPQCLAFWLAAAKGATGAETQKVRELPELPDSGPPQQGSLALPESSSVF
jgi:hypothetical protein